MSERIMSQQSDRVDVESLGDSHQAPVNVRSLPPISMVGAGDFRFNVSVPRAEEQQYALSVDASLTRTDNSVHPRSVGSGRDQLQQGARVATDPLFGQLSYAGSVTGTSIVTRHVNPIDASVQGPRFVAMPPQSITTPIVSQPISVVRQVATPPVSVATSPVQVVVSASGAFAPAIVSSFDGTSAVPSIGSGIPPNPAVTSVPLL